MPILTITDVSRNGDDSQTREKTVALFGLVIYKLSESWQTSKNNAIGFNSNGNGLTFVEDE